MLFFLLLFDINVAPSLSFFSFPSTQTNIKKKKKEKTGWHMKTRDDVFPLRKSTQYLARALHFCTIPFSFVVLRIHIVH